MTETTLDFDTIKLRQQQTWATGDFAIIGSRLALVGETLCESVDLKAGSRVLDIACGAGTASLAAARRFGDVIGIDYVPALLERGRECAAAERLVVTFQEGDAENLDFPDAAFDVVLSTFGIMFAPNQPRAASEMLRVVRSGGTIGMTNWVPEGYWGQVFALTSRYMPPPPGLNPPPRWGTEQGVRELIGDGVSELRFEHRFWTMRYRSPEHWIDFFRAHFGPISRAFSTLDAERGAAYKAELLEIIARFNRATDGSAKIPAEYLETVAIRK
jgi:SAM-dependent methyltransferase